MKVVKQISYFGLVALLGLSTFAQSDTLYGEFRYSVNSMDLNDVDTFSADNNASRFGMKGEYGEEDGLKAFYHLQTGVNVDGAGDAFSQRFFFAGIKGNFGKLVFGRTSTPYKMAGLRVDPFYDTSAGNGFGGSNHGLSGLTNGWSDNTLAYTSPKVGNVTFNASTYLDDSDAGEHDANVGFTYAKDAFTAGVQYVSVGDTAVIAKSAANSSAVRVFGSYKKDMWNFGASVESISPDMGADQQYIYLSTTYQSSDKVKFAASYGSVEDVSIAADGTSFTFGAFYQLLKNTNVYSLISDVSAEDSTGNERNVIAFGIVHKFSL